jgi:hypothetical protein
VSLASLVSAALYCIVTAVVVAVSTLVQLSPSPKSARVRMVIKAHHLQSVSYVVKPTKGR